MIRAPNADLVLAVSAMAHVTRHLGFGITSNLPESLDAVVSLLVPELQAPCVFKTAYR